MVNTTLVLMNSKNAGTSTWRWYGVWLSFVLLVGSGCGTPHTTAPPSTLGDAAPGFTLRSVQGERVPLRWPALLAFLDVREEASAESRSRAQAVGLRSMHQQYAAQGLNIYIIDTSLLNDARTASTDELVNISYDWHIAPIPLLIDEQQGVAQTYGVRHTPTTLLIDQEGAIKQRWDGFAATSQLGPALTASFVHDTQLCANAPEPQARFMGLDLARPLDQTLWVVDGGRSWPNNTPVPLMWIVLSHELLQEAHLSVRQIAPDMPPQPLATAPLVRIPEQEAQHMLESMPDRPPYMYSANTELTTVGAGCLQIEAIVQEENAPAPVFSAQTVIPVK